MILFQLLLLYNGFRHAEDIFKNEHAQNRVQTWLYRAAGWFIAFLGKIPDRMGS